MSNIDEGQPAVTDPLASRTAWDRRDAVHPDAPHHDIDQDDYDAMSPHDREALPPEVLADLGPDAIADRLRPKIDLDKVPPEERHHINLAHAVVHALGLDTTFFNVAHVLRLMHAEGIEPSHTTAANEYPKHVVVLPSVLVDVEAALPDVLVRDLTCKRQVKIPNHVKSAAVGHVPYIEYQTATPCIGLGFVLPPQLRQRQSKGWYYLLNRYSRFQHCFLHLVTRVYGLGFAG